jgi:hypothetical protein
MDFIEKINQQNIEIKLILVGIMLIEILIPTTKIMWMRYIKIKD